jgi:hypothetical protein
MYYITILPKGGVPPPVGYPLRLALSRRRASRASRGAFVLPALCFPMTNPCGGLDAPPTSSRLDGDRGAFAPTPGPHDQGHFIAPWTLDQPSAGWMRANVAPLDCAIACATVRPAPGANRPKRKTLESV